MNKENKLSNKICPENMTIEEWQIALRRETALESKFEVQHQDDNRIWGDYMVVGNNGRYRVAFRGVLSDRNYCSCLDFRTNGLGTCKHLEAVTLYLQNHVEGYPWAGLQYNPPYTSIYVSYKGGRSIKIRVGDMQQKEFMQLAQEYFDEDFTLPENKYELISEIVGRAEAISSTFRCYDDVYELVESSLVSQRWTEQIASKYPDKRVPLLRATLELFDNSQLRIDLEELLYKITANGSGLLVSPQQPYYPLFILRLAEMVLAHSSGNKQGLIILQSEEEKADWDNVKNFFPGIDNQLEILSATEFTEKVSAGMVNACFVYVDKANSLKEWRDQTSVAIKRMSIEHLYMRIDTMAYLTPVQLSSILQHISPFIIGPFYIFIHTYRPIFPLKDDGSNMPPETEKAIFPINPGMIGQIGNIVMPDSVTLDFALNNETIDIKTADGKVQLFLNALKEVLNDPDALELLNNKLNSLK